MPVLGTSNITVPHSMAAGVWQKAVSTSVVAKLVGAQPQKFGTTDIMTFSAPPKAEYVAEAGQKGTSGGTFGLLSVVPHKAHVTLRFNEEVLWADEDYQLGVIQTVSDAVSVALSRALDLGVIHRINPLTGTAAASIASGTQINSTTQRVETVGASTTDTELETAAGLVIANGYVPNGIAFDPKYAWGLATARYSDGRRKFPEVGYGQNITAFSGLNAAVGNTVSGVPEATDTKLRAIIGDWNQLRWGVQRSIPLEKILFGDPDGQGDLKRQNQFALRAEVVYGWVFTDINAFAVVNDLV